MVGYGSEDNHFVVELTYNYGISSYKLGDDFLGITIQSKEAIENAKKQNWPIIENGDLHTVESPGGYKFYLIDEIQSSKEDPVKKVTLSCSDLQKSIDYWNKLCEMNVYSQSQDSVLMGFGDEQCKLELKAIGKSVEHAKAFGRIAFSCPQQQLPGIEQKVKETGEKILTPLISLDTPGKATVQVVILADPDGHEICFVGDEAFRELSQLDPKADELLNQAMATDASNEWFAKKGRSKAEA